MVIKVHNQKNKREDVLQIPERILNAPWRPDLVHQVLISTLTSARRPIAHTKGRGEVKGGGRKPWRQKHTGRARHGSIRSPLWAGGGVTFGPRNEKNFTRKVNKKMRFEALLSVLANKSKNGLLNVVDEISLKDGKTKNMKTFIDNFFGGKKPSLLIVAGKINKNIFSASKNIPGVKAVAPNSLNIYDCLKYANIILEKDAANEILGQSYGKSE